MTNNIRHSARSAEVPVDRPLPDIAPVVRRLRHVRESLPTQDTDPEVWDELRKINVDLEHARKKATALML